MKMNGENKPKRYLEINDHKYNLTNGFTNLHTMSYYHILEENGFGIEDVRPAIKLCEEIRSL